MTRIEKLQAIDRALALIGQPRECCPSCGRTLGVKVHARARSERYTPHSAAQAVGVDEQSVYRAYRRMLQEAGKKALQG